MKFCIIIVNLISAIKLFSSYSLLPRLPTRKLHTSTTQRNILESKRGDDTVTNSIESWINLYDGEYNVKLDKGAILRSLTNMEIGEKLLSVPHFLCIFPNEVKHSNNSRKLGLSINPSLHALVDSLDASQWRAKLALLFLHEHSKLDSILHPFTSILPIDPPAVPVYFSLHTIALLEGLPIMKKIGIRNNFLIATPQILRKLNPATLKGIFPGKDLHSSWFEWSFLNVCARSIRLRHGGESIHSYAPVFEYLDYGDHPNCQVRISPDHASYELVATRNITTNEKLILPYPEITNDEWFLDFGRTIDDNPFDTVQIEINNNAMNCARAIVGQIDEEQYVQSSYYCAEGSSLMVDGAPASAGSNRIQSKLHKHSLLKSVLNLTATELNIKGFIKKNIGIPGNIFYDERFFHQWQRKWVEILNFTGPNTDSQEYIGFDLVVPEGWNQSVNLLEKVGVATGVRAGRIWALLRLMYASSEEEILQHGYDPFTLQHPHALLGSTSECNAIITMIGLLSAQLAQFRGELCNEVDWLISGLTKPYMNSSKIANHMVKDQLDYSQQSIRKVRRQLIEIIDYFENMTTNASSKASSKSDSQVDRLLHWQRAAVSANVNGEERTVLEYLIRKKITLIRLLFECFQLLKMHLDEINPAMDLHRTVSKVSPSSKTNADSSAIKTDNIQEAQHFKDHIKELTKASTTWDALPLNLL